MIGSKELIEEDWERCALTDSIYLGEARIDKEHAWWEWYHSQPATIVVENEDGTETVKEVITDDYHLPF